MVARNRPGCGRLGGARSQTRRPTGGDPAEPARNLEIAGRQDPAPATGCRRVPDRTMRTRSRDAPPKPELAKPEEAKPEPSTAEPPSTSEPSKGRDGPNDRSEPMSDPARRAPDAAPRET